MTDTLKRMTRTGDGMRKVFRKGRGKIQKLQSSEANGSGAGCT